jgi:hypothetical protein
MQMALIILSSGLGSFFTEKYGFQKLAKNLRFVY